MHSSAFPWLSNLTDEQAYEFLDEVIRAAQDARDPHRLSSHVGHPRKPAPPTLPHRVMP